MPNPQGGDSGAAPPAQPKARVLVVDDDRVMREMLEDILADCGYVVEVAANGDEALEHLHARHFDLLLTDMRMPGLDGFAVLEEARTVSPDTDVIVMTGYASVDIAVECMRRGAADFITKPFNVDHIKLIAARSLETKALRKKAAQRDYFEELALKDWLTGLYNRRYFTQLLETEIARSRRGDHSFVLLMLDLDDFKQFNDRNGHLAGDEALRKIAYILNHHSRTSDVVARFGGEEFALILPEMTRAEGQLAAERLRSVVERTDVPGEENLPSGRLTISVGLALYPEDGETPEALIDHADRALYRAKDAGKNIVRTWPDADDAPDAARDPAPEPAPQVSPD